MSLSYPTPSLIFNDTQISHIPALCFGNLISALSPMLMLLCCSDSFHIATCSFASFRGPKKGQ